ncbi:MAG: RHS repeat protein [Planctomycetes bacterium]|nr:RHS repeat protein [Planctomycetota bacterium]
MRQMRIMAAACVMLSAAVAVASTYEYDDLHRLTRVTYDDGSAILYEYDAVGNRTLRVINGDPSSVYLETSVDPPSGGEVTRDLPGPWYPLGTPVELTAVPEGLCEFDQWTGDVPEGHESDNPLTITMDAYKSLTASFTLPLGDADCDCDLDMADFAGFQLCFDESPLSPECAIFDLDGDEDVDLDDFELWALALTGPNE